MRPTRILKIKNISGKDWAQTTRLAARTGKNEAQTNDVSSVSKSSGGGPEDTALIQTEFSHKKAVKYFTVYGLNQNRVTNSDFVVSSEFNDEWFVSSDGANR